MNDEICEILLKVMLIYILKNIYTNKVFNQSPLDQHTTNILQQLSINWVALTVAIAKFSHTIHYSFYSSKCLHIGQQVQPFYLHDLLFVDLSLAWKQQNTAQLQGSNLTEAQKSTTTTIWPGPLKSWLLKSCWALII